MRTVDLTTWLNCLYYQEFRSHYEQMMQQHPDWVLYVTDSGWMGAHAPNDPDNYISPYGQSHEHRSN